MAHEEVLESAVTGTFPGPDNNDVMEMAHICDEVLAEFIDETNDWFMVEKVHLYRDRLGVTASYRWTIERWAATGMDRVLQHTGWKLDHHLLADWREIEEDEIEARYSKEILGVPVHVNFVVEMTNRAFESINSNEPIERETESNMKEVNRILEDIS